jgi:serine/threonine protein kinase
MTEPGTPDVDELKQRLQAALGDGYVVEKPLGAGGFAVVYLVRDLSLKRSLAVKVLSPDLISSKTVLERFRREAETVAQLSHPNIVPLHFIGEKDGLLYLAMACIDGGSVADRLDKEGPLPFDDVARILIEVSGALAHAHRRGVVHRDIKPQNVLIDSDSGRSLVTDFGIAKAGESSLTATGMFVGTPAYLAPEQVSGDPSDHRADIYALGVMGYEIIAGKTPFDAPTPTAILMKRLAGPPEPLTKIRKDTPTDLAAVIDACMAADPEQRFQTAADIAAALGGDMKRTPTLPGGRIIRRPKSRTPLYVGVAVAIIGITAAVILSTRPAKRAVSIGPTVPVEMVTVPAGSYVIGRSGKGNDSPAHTVSLAEFSIDKTEVTIAAYKEYVEKRGAIAPWSDSTANPNLPVTGVLWPEATQYCSSWRGGRLPTEEEWEAAARGTAATRYPWGDVMRASRANTESAHTQRPMPVGSYPESNTALGVQDMIGNVWEWTSSKMEPYPGSPSRTRQTEGQRVIRGGAFSTTDSVATVSARVGYPEIIERRNLDATGFRCARDVTPSR